MGKCPYDSQPFSTIYKELRTEKNFDDWPYIGALRTCLLAETAVSSDDYFVIVTLKGIASASAPWLPEPI